MTNLVKIDLSEVNLPMLFERAFSENQMIKKVTLPNNLETIGDYAFSDCRSLTSIKITSTVQGGIITLEIPEKNLLITCRLQDVLAVISAANKAYLEQQSGTKLPHGQE